MTITQRARLYYVFTDYFNGTLLTYLPLFLKHRFQYSGSEFGTVLLVAGIFAVLGILIGPMIVNRFKKEKSVMIIEFTLMLFSIGLIAISSNFYVIILATGLCYLNRMAMYSIGDNMMADIGKEHGIPFGRFRSFGSIGWGLCFLVNGFLVINHQSWFLIVWAVATVIAIFNLIKLDEKTVQKKQASLIEIKTVKEISKYKNAIHYLIIATMMYILLQTASPFVNFMVLELGGRIEIYSTVTAALVIIEFLVMFYANEVRKKISDQQYVELIVFLLIIKMLIISFASSPYLVYGSAILDPIIFGLILPFNPDYLKASVPKKFNATILSFFGIVSLIAMALASKLAGNIMDLISTKAVFIGYLLLAVLIMLLVKVFKIKESSYRREEE